jgi:ATP-binding cassette subfamily B protein
MQPHDLFWPDTKIGEGLFCLAQARRWGKADNSAPLDLPLNDDARLGEWVERVAQELALETEPVRFVYGETRALLRSAGPAILRPPTRLAQRLAPRFLLLLRSDRRWAYLIANDKKVHRFSHEVLHDLLWQESTAGQRAALEQLLTQSGFGKSRQRLQRVLLAEMLGNSVSGSGWLLRLPPGAGLGTRLRAAQLPQTLAVLFGSYLAQLSLTLLAWWLIGQGALRGEFTWSGLWAWALVLLTTIPFQLTLFTAQRHLVWKVGEIFKTRLLYGALRLHPEEIRHQGAGNFLGQVLAADAVEQLSLAGSLVTALAGLQLISTFLILTLAAGSWLVGGLLVGWTGLLVAVSWRYAMARNAYSGTQRAMTNALVEQMVGHRTRLVQEDPAQWHGEEDGALERYVRLQTHANRVESWLSALPRGWMTVGLGGFVGTLLLQPLTPSQLALSLGGILLGVQAFTGLAAGWRSIVQVQRGWNEIRNLFAAASRPAEIGPLAEFRRWIRLEGALQTRQGPADPSTLTPTQAAAGGESRPELPQQPLLKVEGLTFRYRPDASPVVAGCHLQINPGDQILLTGLSGSGKSTLAALLAGLRVPSAGRLSLSGYDQNSLGGAYWRRRIVLVPQFHENYILTGTLAFNLLLGRQWPPAARDLLEAEEICKELGLGELLKRMPAGLEQMVGESGWRLSHGERSRIYVARSLLQRADLWILDESFGALDAESLQIALRCVRQRAATLLVIAHH